MREREADCSRCQFFLLPNDPHHRVAPSDANNCKPACATAVHAIVTIAFNDVRDSHNFATPSFRAPRVPRVIHRNLTKMLSRIATFFHDFSFPFVLS